MSKYFVPLTVFICTLLTAQNAAALLNPNAENIKLLMDCGSETNCTTSTSEMIDWTNVGRFDPNKPVLITIGPGRFSMPDDRKFCENSKNVSYTGAGRDITVLTGGADPTLEGNYNKTVLNIKNCANLSFQDLTIEADTWSSPGSQGSSTGVSWEEIIKGSKTNRSNWTNIDIKAGDNGWYDNGGLHYFFSSSVTTQSISGSDGMAPYYSKGGETWFYGGEIHARHNSSNPVVIVTAILMNGGEMRVFGSAVRVTADSTASNVTPFDIGGLLSIGNGVIHMHGGIVSVNASAMTNDQNVYGVATNAFSGPGFIHMPGTAFNIAPGGAGTAYRVKPDSGTTLAPFLWPSGSTLPNISSKTGSDIFIETDCDDIGNCENSTNEVLHPHIMIFDENCSVGGNNWFDSTRGVCRGE